MAFNRVLYVVILLLSATVLTSIQNKVVLVYLLRVISLRGIIADLYFFWKVWNILKFPNFPIYVAKFGNGQAPRGRCLSISKFWKVWKIGKFGKFGKHAPAVATPLFG